MYEMDEALRDVRWLVGMTSPVEGCISRAKYMLQHGQQREAIDQLLEALALIAD